MTLKAKRTHWYMQANAILSVPALWNCAPESASRALNQIHHATTRDKLLLAVVQLNDVLNASREKLSVSADHAILRVNLRSLISDIEIDQPRA